MEVYCPLVFFFDTGLKQKYSFCKFAHFDLLKTQSSSLWYSALSHNLQPTVDNLKTYLK